MQPALPRFSPVSQPAPAQRFFLPEMFRQTLHLIRDAQNYFETEGKLQLPLFSQPVQLLYATEMSRVTMRLSCVMAWCLGQQALVRGEINSTESLEHFRLEGGDICLQETADHRELPPTMLDVLDESQQLYERAWRLDQEMAKSLLN